MVPEKAALGWATGSYEFVICLFGEAGSQVIDHKKSRIFFYFL